MFKTCVTIACSCVLTCVGVAVNAQGTNQESVSFVKTAIIRISTKLAEAEGRDAAAIEATRKAEQEAEVRLKTARTATVKDEQELASRVLAEQAASKRVRQMQASAGAQDFQLALDKLEQTVTARAAAEEHLSVSKNAERSAEIVLEVETTNRVRTEENARAGVQRRMEQRSKLEKTKERWQADPTEENLVELSEEITAVAMAESVQADVTWKSTPTSGAIIFYQTKRSREKGDKPESIANPTATPQKIFIGRYYVWAERGGRVTSDKDRLIPIAEETTSVTVIEDH